MKHYLRGEEGINYLDLYHLVKFLPSYSFPEGIARDMEDQCVESASNLRRTNSRASRQSVIQQQQSEQQNGGELEAKDSYDSDEKPKFTVTPATARQSAEDLHLAPTASVTGAHSTSSGRGPHVTLELPLPATSKRKPALGLNLLRPGLRTYTSSRTNGSISISYIDDEARGEDVRSVLNTFTGPGFWSRLFGTSAAPAAPAKK